MADAETPFHVAMAHAEQLYAISKEELLLAINGGDALREPIPRPDLAIGSLRPAARATIESYFQMSPASSPPNWRRAAT